MSNPLVSILIPCFNCETMIERCLVSCLNQSYRPIEIIVVDNNSTDNSIQVIEKLIRDTPDLIKLCHREQQGANYARNHAFTLSQGEFIQWLDSDDELNTDKIERQVAALSVQMEFGIAYSNTFMRVVGDDKNSRDVLLPTQQFEDNLRHLLEHYWLPPHAYLLRRNVAEQLHELLAWEPSRPCLQDAEYYLCAAAIGHRFLYVPDTAVIYNDWSEQQTSRSTYHTKTRAQARQAIHKRVKRLYLERQENTNIDTDENILFLLGSDANFWRLDTQMAHLTNASGEEKTSPPTELDEFETEILNLLIEIEKFSPAVEGRSFEEIAETLLFSRALIEWCMNKGLSLSAQSIDAYKACYDELPIRPPLHAFGLWSRTMRVLDKFARIGLLKN